MAFTKNPVPKPHVVGCRLTKAQKDALKKKCEKKELTVQTFLENLILREIGGPE